MTSCLTCIDWALRASPAHAKVGLAACAHGPSWSFTGGSKTCTQHRPASVEIIAGRTAYFLKLGVKQCE